MFGRNKIPCYHHRGKHRATGWLQISVRVCRRGWYGECFAITCVFIVLFSTYGVPLSVFSFTILLDSMVSFFCTCISASGFLKGLIFGLTSVFPFFLFCSLFAVVYLMIPLFFYCPVFRGESGRGVTNVCWKSFGGIGAVLFVFLLSGPGIWGRRGSFLYGGLD